MAITATGSSVIRNGSAAVSGSRDEDRIGDRRVRPPLPNEHQITPTRAGDARFHPVPPTNRVSDDAGTRRGEYPTR